jgi:predicted nucleic acid-binding protein
MAITVGSRIFIDTNVLIYANLAQSPFHNQAVARLREFENNELELYVSRQVLRNTWRNPARRLDRRDSCFFARSGCEALRPVVLRPKQPPDYWKPSSKIRLLEQIHDANMYTMLVHNSALLTHNTADFKRYKKSLQSRL